MSTNLTLFFIDFCFHEGKHSNAYMQTYEESYIEHLYESYSNKGFFI